MRLDFWFRLSFYVTLGVACAAVAYAEEPFLPGISYLLAPVFGLMTIAFLIDGRWQLTIRASNLVGFFIIVAGGVAGYLLFFRWNSPLREALPLPIGIIPYLGPVLMALIVAKLFRPKKIADFWALQGMGLMTVALGAALTVDWPFGLLMLAYLLSGTWCLMLFALFRAREAAVEPGAAGGKPASPDVPWRWLGLGQAAGWVPLVLVLAFLLFLITPRHGNTDWHFGLHGGGLKSGMGDASIDLNRTGVIELSSEIVFEVIAEDANGARKLELPPNLYWRGTTLGLYDNGRWPRQRMPTSAPPLTAARPRPAANNFFLTYRFDLDAPPVLFLAEPIVRPTPDAVALVPLWENAGPQPWVQYPDGTLRPLQRPSHDRFEYKQMTATVAEPGVGPPVRALNPDYERMYRQPAPALVVHWTERLLARLVAENKLTAADLQRDPERGGVLPENREKVARVLQDYFVYSGDFTYTLDLRRYNTNIDPTADFLLNVKSGHCERYATALTLMLRALGIPARVVLGFMGHEAMGDGVYEVRENHAHSWVEALIARPGRTGPEYRWLTLDPTPADNGMGPTPFTWAQWWSITWGNSGSLWKDFIVEYNADRQQASTLALLDLFYGMGDTNGGRSVPWGLGAAGLMALVCVLVLAWAGSQMRKRVRRRAAGAAASPGTVVAFYARFLALLAPYGLRPARGQTPLEFGESVALRLRDQGAEAPLAEAVAALIPLFYRVRFGSAPLSEDEQRQVGASIDRLEAWFRQTRSARAV